MGLIPEAMILRIWVAIDNLQTMKTKHVNKPIQEQELKDVQGETAKNKFTIYFTPPRPFYLAPQPPSPRPRKTFTCPDSILTSSSYIIVKFWPYHKILVVLNETRPPLLWGGGGGRTAWITSPIPMIGIKVKSCKYIIRRVDQEILADVSWNIIKNCTQRRGSWSIKSEEIWHQMK